MSDARRLWATRRRSSRLRDCRLQRAVRSYVAKVLLAFAIQWRSRLAIKAGLKWQ